MIFVVMQKGEVMSDSIDRQAAIDAVEFGITYAKVINKETGEVVELFRKSNDELRKAVDRIKQLPPSPSRPTGYWMRMSDLNESEDDRYKCSCCGNVVHHRDKVFLYTYNSWCGACGANMNAKNYAAYIQGGAALATEYIKQLPYAQPELPEWAQKVEEYRKSAPSHIHNPLAWALYQTWKEYDR